MTGAPPIIRCPHCDAELDSAGEQAAGIARCTGCDQDFALPGKSGDELKVHLNQVRDFCRSNADKLDQSPKQSRPAFGLTRKMAFCTVASFLFCFGLGLFAFDIQRQQGLHERETQKLRTALLGHELKEMRAANTAEKGILSASISTLSSTNDPRIKEAAWNGTSGDNSIVTSNWDDGVFHIEINAKQAEYLTQNVSAGDVQRYIGVVKMADENDKDKTSFVARIVEVK